MVTWLLIAAVAAIPLGTRLLIATVIPGFHEYEALFVYASDIVVLAYIVAAWRSERAAIRALILQHGGPLLFVGAVASIAAALAAPSLTLSAYALLRLVIVVIFAYSLAAAARRQRLFQYILIVLAVAAVIEAGIGLAQFNAQESIGLSWLGEPVLSPVSGSTSTIVAEGGRILRVYGTFPHPNVYAAFLLVGLLSLVYWYQWCEHQLAVAFFKHARSWWTLPRAINILKQYLTHRYFWWRLAIVASSFFVILGLTISLSRSGWLSALVGVIVFVVIDGVARKTVGGSARLVLMLLTCAVAIYLLLQPVISPRVHVAPREPAVAERVSYTALGFEILSQEMLGVGPGNQVLYGVNNHVYQAQGLTQVWYWEPIHNLYLLLGVEIGWLGLLSFIALLGMVTWRLLRQTMTLESAIVLSLLAAVLTLGLFDHFLWTLQPGKLLLWLTIGLALSQLRLQKTRS